MRALGVRLSLVVSLVGVGVGCSSSGGNGAGGNGANSLDCAWLASENCWKTTATSASSCLPPAAETGVLSADNTTCSYASGAVVTFTQPLVLPVPDNPTWNFTIANNGEPCLHYQETQTGFTLTVGSQVVKEGSTGALGVQIECPDGASYSNSDAFALLECGANDGGLFFGNGLPGNATAFTETSLSFFLVGTSLQPATDLKLFDCAK